MSYNNFNDAHAALALAAEFSQPAAVAVARDAQRVGTGATPVQAFVRAREADPVSIFGGIVAFNCPVDAETAAALAEIFLEVVAAPDFTAAASGKSWPAKRTCACWPVRPGRKRACSSGALAAACWSSRPMGGKAGRGGRRAACRRPRAGGRRPPGLVYRQARQIQRHGWRRAA